MEKGILVLAYLFQTSLNYNLKSYVYMVFRVVHFAFFSINGENDELSI